MESVLHKYIFSALLRNINAGTGFGVDGVAYPRFPTAVVHFRVTSLEYLQFLNIMHHSGS